MAEAGILSEDDRVELIDGEIVEMTAIGSRHAECVGRLTELFFHLAANRARVRGQNPVRVGPYSEPEPDLALVRPRSYVAAHPESEDILLTVEVADTTADTDGEIKYPLYARAGILETWLVDLQEGFIEVCRKPSAGGYREIRQHGPGEQISPEALPDCRVSVDDVLV